MTGGGIPPKDGSRPPDNAKATSERWTSFLPDKPTGRVNPGDEATSETDVTLIALAKDDKKDAASGAPKEPIFSSRRLVILLMLGAIFSKMLGLLREVGMAHMFGTTLTADAFRAALTGVFLPLAILQNETVPAVLIPMYRDWRERARIAQRFTALAITVTLLGAIIMAGVAWASSYWVMALVGGFTAEARELTRVFIMILALGMPASVLLNILSAAEIALGRSRLATIRASMLNISMILGLAVVFLTGSVLALPIAFVVAFNGLALWGVITLRREGILSFEDLRWSDVGEVQKEFWRRIRPLLAMPIAEQANIWIERLTASRLGIGAVSAIDYARTITESAVLFISQPLGLALLALPADPKPRERVEKLSRPLLACGLPICVWLAIFGPEVTAFLFSRGAFNQTAVELTGQALRGISIGLWATTLGWVLLRMLNSAGQNRQATVILLAGFVVNMTSNLILAEVPAAKAYGPFIIGAGESLRGFVLLFGSAMVLGCGRLVLRLTVLAMPMTLVMLGLGLWIDQAIDSLLLKLFLSGFVCLVSIIIGLQILGTGIPKLVVDRLRAKFKKNSVLSDNGQAKQEDRGVAAAKGLGNMSMRMRLLRSAGHAVAGKRGIIFVLHRMAPQEEWARKLNQGFYLNEAFADQFLTYLKQNDWDIVTIEEATRRVREKDFARNFVVFTLDDCYRDTYETVIPLFRRHQVPVTLYVSTGIPDGTMALWDAGLEEVLMTRDRIETEDGPLQLTDHASRVAVHRQLTALWDRNDPATRYRRFCEMNGLDEAALRERHAITWEMLESVRNDPCVEIGGHTISHPHVASLPREEAVREIGGCMERLRERLSVPARHFAFPYGQPVDCGERDFEIARELGLGSTATTTKGLLFQDTDVMRLPRVNINGHHQSFWAMEAHLSGLTSFLARYKR